MKTLVMIGAALTDVGFTLDLPGFPEINWNMTRIEHDAFNGRFGPPEEGRFSNLHDGGPGYDPWKHLDREKVQRLIRDARISVLRPGKSSGEMCRYNLLDIPTIAVTLIKEDVTHIIPIDGNHRMMARQVMGLETYSRFVVPANLEGEYRVMFMEVVL